MLNREYAIGEQAKLSLLRHEKFREFERLGVNHFFTTFNFGHIDIDNPETYEKIRKVLNNRDAKIVFAGQPHGKKICFVDGSQSIIYGHDGLFTNQKKCSFSH